MRRLLRGRRQGQAGKLTWAARQWADGTLGAEPEALRDARRFGFDAASAERLTERLRSNGELQDGVWPDNVETVHAFLIAATQWRVAGTMTGLHFIGLDYAAVRVALDAEGVAVTPALWRGLRTMEAAAIAGLNELNAT